MHAAPAPRLTGGIAISVLLHGAFVGAFFALRPAAEPPSPPMYRVQLIAAPAGDPAAGAVQDAPTAAPPTATPPVAAPAPVATVAKPIVTRKTAKPKPAPKVATPAPKTAAPVSAKPAAAATAAGGSTGGKGADVANVDTPGIEFPYPAYTTNIVSQLIRRFGQMQGTLSASVRFVIRRDGSVDPESIRIVTPSGNYSFDQRALGAVESAANSKAFGALPGGFREDILPVTFRFSPSVIR